MFDQLQYNTIYNCGTGLSIAEWAKPKATFGNNISENLIFCTNSDQNAASLMNWLLPYTNTMATFSNNTYYNFFEKFYFEQNYISENREEKVKVKYNFGGWQNKLVNDKDGNAFELNSELAVFSNSTIYFNSGKTNKVVTFQNSEMYDLKGKRVRSLELLPFTSQIVIYK